MYLFTEMYVSININFFIKVKIHFPTLILKIPE